MKTIKTQILVVLAALAMLTTAVQAAVFVNGADQANGDALGFNNALWYPYNPRPVIVDPATDIVGLTAHGLTNDTRVAFGATTMPAGLTANTFYYVINGTADGFQLSTTAGGAAIDITDAGSAVLLLINSPAYLPVSGAGNQYVTTFIVRSPNNADNATFLGDQLVLNSGGTLRLKASTAPMSPAIINIPALVLNGGVLDNGNDNHIAYLSGNVIVSAPSILRPQGNRWLGVKSAISGSQGLTLDTAGIVVLAGPNANYSGTFTLATDSGVVLQAYEQDSLAKASVVVNNGTKLDIGANVNSEGTLTLNGNGKLFLYKDVAFSAVTITNSPLAPGTYPWSSLFATYPNNIVNYGSGTLTVLGAAAAPTLVADLASKTVAAGSKVTFRFAVRGTGLTYEWRTNDVVDTAASGMIYTIPAATATMTIKCRVSNGSGSLDSAVATLSVPAGPILASVYNFGSTKHLAVGFSKPVDVTSATIANNYAIPGVTVSSAAMSGPSTVVLTTEGFALGTAYTLTVTGVSDTSANPIASPNNVLTFTPAKFGMGYLKTDLSGNPSTGRIPGARYGVAHVASRGSQNIMRLTDSFNDDSGTWVVGDLGLGTNKVSRMTVQYLTTLGGGSDTPADGYCFSFAPDLPDGAWGGAEEGIGSGLSIMFDIYDNTDGNPNDGVGEGPSLDVKMNGSIISSKKLPLTQMVRFPEQNLVTIDLAADGTLNMTYGSVVVASNLATGWTPRTGRFGFGARTGGLNANQWLSDVMIDTYVPYADSQNGPVVFTTQPMDVTQVERGSVSFSVAVTGTPEFSYQWKANGTAIPGATAASYSTVVSMAMNGNTYSVDVTNPFGTFASTAATLTVTNDITPPAIIAGNASEAAGRVRIFFSEPLLDTPAANAVLTNAAYFEIKDSQDTGVDTGTAVATLSADRKSVAIDGLALQAGVMYTAQLIDFGATDVLDLSSNVLATPAITPAFPAWTSFQAGVRWMKYDALSGGAMPNLTNNVNFPYNPNSVFSSPGTYAGFAVPDLFYFHTGTAQGGGPTIGAPDEGNYGAYAATQLRPVETGNYVFQAFSDDGSIVALSTDDNPANKRTIIYQGGCCAWLQSAPIYLEAGKTYYFEALYVEGGGGDGIYIQWRRPSGTAFENITSANDAYAVNYHWFNVNLATNQLADESHPVAIAANIPAAAAFWMVTPTALQWYRSNDDGATYNPITDATNTTYNIAAAALTDNNAKFYLQLSIAGGAYTANSPVQTLNVQPDATAPTVAPVGSQYWIQSVTLNFSEPMDATTAQDINNYTLTAPAVVRSATLLPGGTRVVLTTSVLDPGTPYNVSIQNVTDNSPTHNAIVATNLSFTTPYMLRGFAKREKFKYPGTPGGSINSVKTDANYLNNTPTLVAWLSLFETPTNEDDNYGQRVSTWLIPPATANYRFGTAADDDSELYLSSDASPANKTMIASWYGWSGTRNYQGQSGPIAMMAGVPRYLEALHSEGGGGDNLAVAVGPGDVAIASGAQPIDASWMAYLAPYTVSSTTVTVTQQPVDEMGFENGSAHFTVAGVAANPNTILYQWQRFDGVQWNNLVNSSNITGATSTALTVKNLKQATDNGAQFRCLLSNPGGSIAQAKSATATLTVEVDAIPPYVAMVSGTPYSDMVMVQFSETLYPDIIGSSAQSFTLTGPGVNQPADDLVVIQPDNSMLLKFSGANMTPGQTYTIMVDTTAVYDQAFNSGTYETTNAVSNFVAWASQPNVMRWDRFNGDSGANNFATTIANPKFPNTPDEIVFRDSANSPSGIGELYSVRMVGYFTPPESGTYRFRAEADDAARIIITSDPDAPFASSAAATILNVEGDCGSCGDGHYSSTVNLIARVPYYFELWFKEGTGGDYLYVAFTNDNPSAVYSVWPALGGYGNITSNMLVFAVNPADATILTQPQDRTIVDGTATSLTCIIDSRALPATYQWQRYVGTAFTNIAGATSSTYNTPILSRPADIDARYRCVVSYPGSQQVISREAVITLNPDATPPALVSVNPASDYRSILVRFTKQVTPGSVAAGTYAIDGGVTVLSASLLPDGFTAALLTSFQTPGGVYTLTVTGVQDITENNNPIVPGSQITYTNTIFVPGIVRIRRYDIGSGTAVSVLTGNAAFPNFPTVDFTASAMTYRPNLDNYGAYLTGFFVPPTTGNYTFFTSSDDASQVFLSRDANPANKVMVAKEDNCCGGYVNNLAGSAKYLIAGQTYYIEALIKEGGGGDYIDVAYSTDGGNTKIMIGGSAIGEASLPNPGVSLVITQQPVALTVNAGQSATLVVKASENPVSGFLAYQWQKNGQNIANANSDTYVTPLLSVFDTGAFYRCVVTTKGAAVVSDLVAVAVTKAESDPATLAYVGSVDGLKVGVKFNEPVFAASATNPLNYVVQPVSGFALAPVTRPGDVVAGFPSGTPLLTINFTANDGGFTAVPVGTYGPGPGPWTYSAVSGTWSCFGNSAAGGPYATALQSPALPAPFTGTYYVTFLHRHSFEPDGANGWDGGQFRMSINGGPFTAVTTFSSGGYNGTVNGSGPLQGQQGFVGDSAGYATAQFITSTAVINGINAGDQVTFQFVESSDENTIGSIPNWEVKSLSIADSALAQAWPAAEGPVNAVDGLLRTKYLNFGITNAGVTVTLTGRTQAVSGIRITSANDAPERDPASVMLEGSLNGGAFTVIGTAAVPAFAARGSQQTIMLPAPSAPYTAYRVTFPTVASTNANAMQVAEVELLGVATAAKVVSAVVQGDSTVVLTLDTPVKGQFSIGSQGIIDLSGNTNALAFITGNCLEWNFMDSSLMVSGNPGDPNPAGQIDWSVSTDTKTVVKVGGSDIWETADGFNFIYREVDGDFDISTRIESVDPSSTWAKAGLMIRESLAANSRNHNIIADPKTTPPPRSGNDPRTGANMIEANARYAQGGGPGEWNKNGGSGNARFNPVTGELPYPNVWVRMVRQQGMLYGYASIDGLSWTNFISELDPYPTKVFVGRCTTSHNQGDNTTVVYSDLRYTQLVKLATDTSGGTLKITWPADPSTGYILQGAFSLQPGAQWLPVTQGIITNGNTKVFTVPSNPLIPSEFYRLIKP